MGGPFEWEDMLCAMCFVPCAMCLCHVPCAVCHVPMHLKNIAHVRSFQRVVLLYYFILYLCNLYLKLGNVILDILDPMLLKNIAHVGSLSTLESEKSENVYARRGHY